MGRWIADTRRTAVFLWRNVMILLSAVTLDDSPAVHSGGIVSWSRKRDRLNGQLFCHVLHHCWIPTRLWSGSHSPALSPKAFIGVNIAMNASGKLVKLVSQSVGSAFRWVEFTRIWPLLQIRRSEIVTKCLNQCYGTGFLLWVRRRLYERPC